MEQIKNFITQNLVGVCIKIVVTVLIIVVGFWLVKVLMKLLGKSRLYSKLDPSVKSFLDSFIKFILKAVVIVTAITYAGVPMATVIALVGSAGVAIGLALQGGLSNVAGGVLILMNRPFKVGDYISVSGNDGTVESISLFYTTIKSYDGKRIVLPNGTVTSSVVVNVFAEDHRRVDLVFSASYSSDIDHVKKTLLEVASENSRVLSDPVPVALMTEQADYALKYTLRAWVKTPDYWDATVELNEGVKKAFDREGIEIPFPQFDLHNK